MSGHDDGRQFGELRLVIDKCDDLEMTLGVATDDEPATQNVLGKNRPAKPSLDRGIDYGLRHQLPDCLGTGPAHDRLDGCKILVGCEPYIHINEPTPHGPSASVNLPLSKAWVQGVCGGEFRRGEDVPFDGGSCRGAICLLYTSDAADDLLCVDLGGRRIIKKK